MIVYSCYRHLPPCPLSRMTKFPLNLRSHHYHEGRLGQSLYCAVFICALLGQQSPQDKSHREGLAKVGEAK